jgi:hypothetical protein
MPSFGIVSNGGKIVFLDNYGTIKDLITKKNIKKGTEINIYLNNTILNIQSKVGKFWATQFEYDNDNKKVTAKFDDGLEELQKTLLTPIGYQPNSEKKFSFEFLYNFIYERTPSKHNMLRFRELDEKTRNVLSQSYFEFFILNSKNIWDAWNKLCEACQCHIFKTREGQTICIYNEGN